MRVSHPRFSEGRFEIFTAQRQICVLQASPALSEHQVDLAKLPSLPLLVLWQLVSEQEPEGSEVLPVLPPVAARPSAGLVPGWRGAGGSGFLPRLADPNISKACKAQELTAVPPNWCPPGQRSNYSSALPQPRHHRGMCWPAGLHVHTCDAEKSPAKAEDDAGGDCARKKRGMEGI